MNISGLWDQLVDCICRPPRDDYSPDSLIGGRSGVFRIGSTDGKRIDLKLTNKQGLKLECSHFVRKPTAASPGPWPCVVYCHCNSGSRKDAEEAVYLLLPLGITVFCMDFAGSGRSEGQWVTLGAGEADDLEVVIQHLREQENTTTIGLWGRSMGAVTCLLYSRRDPSIAGMVLDSPFSKLTDLMMELVSEQKMRIPKPLMKMAVGAMRRSVKKRAKCDINDVSPLDVVGESFIPALFGHADGDHFIKMRHSQLLYDAYAGDKTFFKFGGDHNTRRPESFYTSVYIFFHNTLCASLVPGAPPMSRDDLCEQACHNLTLHNQQTRNRRRDLAVPWNYSPTETLLDDMPNAQQKSATENGSSNGSIDASDVFQDNLMAQLAYMADSVQGELDMAGDFTMTEEEQIEQAIRLSMMDASDSAAGESDSVSSVASSSGPVRTGPRASRPSRSPPDRGSPTPKSSSSPNLVLDEEAAMIQQAIRLSLQDFNPKPSSENSSCTTDSAQLPKADATKVKTMDAAQSLKSDTAQSGSDGSPLKRAQQKSHKANLAEERQPLLPNTPDDMLLLGDVVDSAGPLMDSLKAEAELEALQNSAALKISGKH